MENQELEIWKDIEGYEGLYQISSFGRAKSCVHFTHKKDMILKPCLRETGYHYINLYKNHKGRKFYIHRLVANAFLPKINGKDVVNHKDLNKTNNNVFNLEWCTTLENIQHSWDMGVQTQVGEKHHCSKLTWEQVEFIRSHYKYKDKTYNGIQLAKMFNVKFCTIYRIVKGEIWQKK